jgi:hypothetical protein
MPGVVGLREKNRQLFDYMIFFFNLSEFLFLFSVNLMYSIVEKFSFIRTEVLDNNG